MFAHSGDSNFLNDTGSIFANLNLNSTRFWLLFHLHSPLLFSPYFAISCCRKLAIGNVYLVALTFDIAQFSSRQMSGLCNAQITSTQAESAGEECRNNSLFVWGRLAKKNFTRSHFPFPLQKQINIFYQWSLFVQN